MISNRHDIKNLVICKQILDKAYVVAGLTWVYTQYCKESFCSQWSRNQEEARSAKINLWSIPNPTPPWEFRHPTGKSIDPKSINTAPVDAVLGKNINPKSDTATVEKQFHGNQRSHVFHRPGCQHYSCPNCTAAFKSRQEALEAGYRPCKACNP